MKNIFLAEHHEMLPFFKTLSEKKEYVLVNVDSRSDMSIPSNNINGINFMANSIMNNYFSKIIWIKDNESFDADDGFYDVNIFWDPYCSEWRCDFENRTSFLHNYFSSYKKDDIEDYYGSLKFDQGFKKVQVEVISEKNLSSSKFAGLDWVLSIDCDFFSATNPFKSDLLKSAAVLGEQKSIEIKNTFLKIKTYQEWNNFKKNLILSKEWKEADAFLKNYNIETFYSDQEIEEKMQAVIKFLKTNFEKQKCLSALTCFSFFSGYTQRERCPKIVSTIDTIFKNFDYFWEKA